MLSEERALLTETAILSIGCLASARGLLFCRPRVDEFINCCQDFKDCLLQDVKSRCRWLNILVPALIEL